MTHDLPLSDGLSYHNASHLMEGKRGNSGNSSCVMSDHWFVCLLRGNADITVNIIHVLLTKETWIDIQS